MQYMYRYASKLSNNILRYISSNKQIINMNVPGLQHPNCKPFFESMKFCEFIKCKFNQRLFSKPKCLPINLMNYSFLFKLINSRRSLFSLDIFTPIVNGNGNQHIFQADGVSSLSDDNLPSSVTLLTTPEGAKVYLIGTSHLSLKSKQDVSRIIQWVQPHCVVIELCDQRKDLLDIDEDAIVEEAKNLNMANIREIIKSRGLINGYVYISFLKKYSRMSRDLGMIPGGEFRIAVHEAKRLPRCHLILGDRRIDITLKRFLSAVSIGQLIKIAFSLRGQKFLTQEAIEESKGKATEIIAAMEEEYPLFVEIFIHERDVYLTNSLQTAAAMKVENEATRVVGVVGMGHVTGITNNWGKVSPRQIPSLLTPIKKPA